MNAHRACDDFHRTSNATRDHYLGEGITRRQVIGRGVMAGLAVYAAQAMPLGRVLEAAHAQAAAAPDAPILVSVFLPGGVDLLDTITPLGEYGTYADNRPRIKSPDGGEFGGTGFGMHPSLSEGVNGGIRGLYEQGKIGLLPGIDYANPDLSHFHSRHFWETGLITHKSASGWLGRHLDVGANGDNPLQAVSVGWTPEPVLRTAGSPTAAIGKVGDWNFWMRGVWGASHDRAMEAWEAISARGTEQPGERAAVMSSRMAKTVVDRLAPFRHDDDEPNPLAGQIEYPKNSRLADRLRTSAELLSAGLGTRLIALDAGNDFDTHDNQGSDLANGLRSVSGALSAFQADIEARGLADRVLTFVWSEFGRRVQQNESNGTDHGAGGLAWVQGTRARSGLLSEYPSLRRLDRGGNLAVTVDFRSVYCSLLEQWLGADAGAVIPRAGGFGRVGLVR